MRRWIACLAACLWLVSLLPAPVALAEEPAALWLDVPFVKQEKDGCGAASIAMVMQYWQREQGQAGGVDAGEIQRALYSRQGHGIYASGLERYLQEHGYRTFAFPGTWDDLQQQMAKGRPVIVALKIGRDNLHYVVVTGLDPRQDVLLKNDPAERKLLKQSRASFEKQWKAAASWMLLAVPQADGSASSR
jgi:ABC-type bacteriocin/lantibiotic exporter with double-glycine peptidase domain